MSEPARTPYGLQACPLCMRVVRNLDEFGVDARSRFVEPMHSDRNVVRRAAGVRTVPAIVDDRTGVTMAESANIIEALERTNGEPAADSIESAESAGVTAESWPDFPDYDAVENARDRLT